MYSVYALQHVLSLTYMHAPLIKLSCICGTSPAVRSKRGANVHSNISQLVILSSISQQSYSEIRVHNLYALIQKMYIGTVPLITAN